MISSTGFGARRRVPVSRGSVPRRGQDQGSVLRQEQEQNSVPRKEQGSVQEQEEQELNAER